MTSLLGTRMPSRTRDHIEKCIETGEHMTKHTVAAAVHCHIVHAQDLLRQYRNAGYIWPVDWEKNGCQWVPVYASKGKRKAKPRAMTPTEKTRRLRKMGHNIRENLRARQRRAEMGTRTQKKRLGLAALVGA